MSIKVPNYFLYINGEDIASKRFEFSPIAGKLIEDPKKTIQILSKLKKIGEVKEEELKVIAGKYYLADSNHIEEAIQSSYSAFLEFKKTTLEKRASILINIQEYLIKERDKFIGLLVDEGHPLKLAIWQYDNMVNGLSKENIDFFCSLVYQKMRTPEEEIILIKKPDGVIFVVPPRNAPASNSLVAVSALLNGNTIIIKPPQRNPISTIFLWRYVVQRALEKNNCPRGVINIIQGNSSAILESCLTSEKVKTVFIFGESENGIELGKKIYSKSKKPILELSGNDRMIIWEDAPLNSEDFIYSTLEAFLGSTQICMLPKIFLVHPAIYKKFIKTLLDKIDIVKPGLPADPATWLSPVGKKKEFFLFLEDALSKGAKVLCGGKLLNYKNEEDSNGIFVQPTILSVEDFQKAFDMLCFQKEIFFPLIPLIKVGNKEDSNEKIFTKMLEITERNAYGLRVSLWTNNEKLQRDFISGIDNCGSIRINSHHIGYSRYLSTHGGVGLTGGPMGELNYMCLRAAHLQGISVRNGL